MNEPTEQDDGLERHFEGTRVLQELLQASGSLVDVEDVVHAYLAAQKASAPVQPVIDALWDEEPRFPSAAHARRLFGNLLGLWDLLGSGQSVDLSQAQAPQPRQRAPRPDAPPDGLPTEEFVEAAWRWLEDHPREREKLEHAFENRQDALVGWLDRQGLADDSFVLARRLLGEVAAFIELTGRVLPPVMPRAGGEGEAPQVLIHWLDDGLFEARSDDEAPLPEHEAAKLERVLRQAAGWLWGAAGSQRP